ncbi:autotransporter assembly complex protein TamA [Zavarzinia sp. CC-PAN008]|uniref:autotransporter assembly complex protein TamA n=1 Tax=Zavarzinia sp. CC-PAN008 TaxID=3243332 RepID=UPI003F74725D
MLLVLAGGCAATPPRAQAQEADPAAAAAGALPADPPAEAVAEDMGAPPAIDEVADEEAEDREPAPAAVEYSPTIEVKPIPGADEDAQSELADLLEASSQLIDKEDEPPASLTALRRRMAADQARLFDVLKAYGHFDGQMAITMGQADGDGVIPVSIVVTPGPSYPLAAVEITGPGGAALPEGVPDAKALGLEVGKPYRSQAIVDAEAKLVTHFGERSRPYARIAKREVVADRTARTISARFEVAPGPLATFGAVTVSGLEDVNRDSIESLITITPGQPADRREIDKTIKNLTGAGVFRSVRVELQEIEQDGAAPVAITLEEGKFRTIAAGAEFDTSTGITINGRWEHRNFFGNRERLRVEGKAGQEIYGLTTTFKRPDLWRREQDFLAGVEILSERRDAYESDSASISAGFERKFWDIYSGKLGVGFEQSRILDDQGERDFSLISLPAEISRDSSDDVLNPTSGSRVSLSVTPYLYNSSDTSGTFIPVVLAGSTYFRMDEEARLILALRGTVGTIIGADREDIPANKRLYAGGGDTVRGFDFQAVGPLDAKGDPIGGTSVIAGTVELRWRVTDTIGIVPFVDAGTVSEDMIPGSDSDIFVGGGIGARYYTPFGPFRVDIATPLVGKRDSDSALQLYISLGQAF